MAERIGGKQLWYVAADGRGFTSSPDMALRRAGGPVVSQGVTNQITVEIGVRHMELWEELLDQMEAVALAEEGGNYLEINAAEVRQAHLTEALAILIYGKSKDPDIWLNAIGLIRRQAEIRYDA